MMSVQITVVQVLDQFLIGCRITEFEAGADPTVWEQKPLRVDLPDELLSEDPLTITRELIALWSEMTNHQ